MHIDRAKNIVAVDATVIRPSESWLELLACTRGTKEHEALLVVDAAPSHVHLALLMIGLQPGRPMSFKEIGVYSYDLDARYPFVLKRHWPKFIPVPAQGPMIAVTLAHQRDGQTVETPANEWVINQRTGEVMADNLWQFTGSVWASTDDGRDIYLADVNGSVLSLVHFGDDLLARPTDLTRDTDHAIWAINESAVPEVGVKVKIRLQPTQRVEP